MFRPRHLKKRVTLPTLLPSRNMNRDDRTMTTIMSVAEHLPALPSESESEEDQLSGMGTDLDLTAFLQLGTKSSAESGREVYKIRNLKSDLTDINAQRILNALNESLWKLETSFLLPLVCRNLGVVPMSVFDRLEKPLGAATASVFDSLDSKPTSEFASLEMPFSRFKATLEDFSKKVASIDDNCSGSQPTEYQSELSSPIVYAPSFAGLTVKQIHQAEMELRRRQRNICRLLLRRLKSDYQLKEFLASFQPEKSTGARALTAELDKARFVTLERVRFGFIAQARRWRSIEEVNLKIRMHREEAKELCCKITKSEAATKRIFLFLDEQIKEVVLNLFAVQKKSAEKVKKRNSLVVGQKEEIEAHEGRIEKHHKFRADLEATLAIVAKEHFQEETKLRQKKYKMETEKENWITKYDRDMGTVQDKFDLLWVVYSAQKIILDRLEAKFAILEVTYDEILATRLAEEQERMRAKKELLEMNESSLVIQSFWRARKIRKEMKRKQERKGKKGKK